MPASAISSADVRYHLKLALNNSRIESSYSTAKVQSETNMTRTALPNGIGVRSGLTPNFSQMFIQV